MKRDLYTWKETDQRDNTSGHMDGADKRYPSEKRPIYMKRDPLKRHYLGTHGLCRQTVSFWKRDLCTWKETYIHGKRRMKETIPRDTWMVQTNGILLEKRPIYLKRDQYIWKETCIYEQRPIQGTLRSAPLSRTLTTHIRGKRPIYMERDLYIWKETYIYGKRPIYMERELCTWENTH